MKVAVINFSGNVGKTTLARHLLAPRMANATIIPIESINADGYGDNVLKGKEFSELLDGLAVLEDVVVDIGASNVEDFLGQMRLYKGSHADFDYYLVPTVPNNKQQIDTINTIETLADIGVPAKNIRVLFNMVEMGTDPEKLFSGLIEYWQSAKKFALRRGAVIHANELYGKIKVGEQSIGEILDDNTDYKELIKTAASTEEKVKFARLLGLKRLAEGVKEELDNVFVALFK
jgi:hypothetical protein